MSCFGLLITYSLFLLHPLLCGLNFDAHNSKSTNSTKPHICISLLALSLLDIYNKNLIKISSQHNFTRRRRREVNNICSMAQATMVMCGFSGQATSLKKQPLLLSQIHRIKPNYSISHLFFSPLPPRSSSFSSSFTAFALFKPKTKAPPPKKVVAKPKKQVEDGIFGTSGGIGFTKQNELFVGRVAMLGFAASLLGEAITGKGILSQLNIETGIPIYEAEPLLLFFILFTLLGAIGALGDRGQFIDDPPTGLEKAVIPPGKGIKSALGLKEGGPLFGFTKSNELFVGRLAQLGFVFSLIGEIITGKGALAQLNIETGVPINEIEPLVLFNVAFFFFAALNPGTGKFITDEEED